MMKKLLNLIVLLCFVSAVYGQDRTITGKIIDENAAPLIGATIQIKGSQKGTVSDLNGAYTLLAPSAASVLVISYIGYKPVEIAIGESNTIDAKLEPDVQNVEQVVVVGYGVQKKSLVTGSISKVDSKDITSAPVARIDQALQGKTSGVYIAQSSGSPGGAMSIRIRGQSSDGQNSPIYIVNGIKVSSIEFLAPSDIESIEILKDAASCAIYGSEGGNGVVIISTKKGKEGISEVNYNYYKGVQTAANIAKPMNASQYIQYMSEANMYENGTVPPKYTDMARSGINTNWVDEIFQTAPIEEHNISFNSASDKNNFLLSASYFNQDGIIGGAKSNFTRYTFLFNGESKIKDWLTIGSSINYTYSKKHNLRESVEDRNGIINSALYYEPTAPIYYKDSSDIPYSDPAILAALVKDSKGRTYYNSEETNLDASNPLALIENTYNTTQINKIVGDVHSEIRFTNWLKFNTRLSLDYALAINDTFQPKFYYDKSNNLLKDFDVSVTNAYTKNYKVSVENYISFSKTFGDHYFDAMAGISYENYAPTFISATGKNIPYGKKDYAYLTNARADKDYPNLVSGGVGVPNNYDLSELQSSYFWRASYNYKEKYMAQTNIRRDGSSLFGPNNKFGFFPSFSLGWNISKETFFTNAISVINNLKLRFSWGRNGNKQILDPFGYLTAMSSLTAYVDNTDNFHLGAIPERPANLNLKWETSQQSDIGLEVGIFKNKVVMSIDRYSKTTIDQLCEQANSPLMFGFSNKPFTNDGEVSNKGWEFDISYRESEGQFKYAISANATYIKNKVISYGLPFKAGYKMNIGDYVTYYEPGYPVWYYKGFKAIGIFQTQKEVDDYKGADGKPLQPQAQPGDVKYADIAGLVDKKIVNKPDGKLDILDKTIIGKPQPDWTFGLNLNCSYKWIDFSMFFQGVTGNQIFYSAIQTSHKEFNKPAYYFTERWHGEGTSNTYPRATLVNTQNFKISNLNVSDGDYLRLKNLTIGFTVPKEISGKIGISKFRIYGSATNVLTFTKYRGTDPEVGQLDITDNSSFGIDRGLYPQARTITVGLNVSF